MASAKLLPMVVAALLCVVMAAPSWAHTVQPRPHQSTAQRIAYFQGVVRHDRQQIAHANSVFRFFEKHPRLLANARGKNVAWIEVKKWRIIKKNHQWQLGWAEGHLKALQPKPTVLTGFPPHHYLWTCIAPYESGGDPHNRHNPSYRGYLQMSYGWLGLISGDPADHSQAEQEWAAETGYRQSGYAHSFIDGQWYKWDNADGCGY